jgi:ankyrin repeat protein
LLANFIHMKVSQISISCISPYISPCRPVVKLLLEYGADLHLKDSHGNSILHISCLSHDLNMAFLLLSMDCDLNQLNSRGETPLMALMNDPSPSLEILILLISMGADVSVANPFTGDNSLHVISSKRD